MKKYKKIYNAILFAIFSNAMFLIVIAEELPGAPDVKFGMFISNLHDVNFTDNEFQVEYWSWSWSLSPIT